MLNVKSSHLEGEMEQYLSYTPQMHELTELYTEEIQSLTKSAENEVVKRSPSKEHKFEMRLKKPKISLDLNKTALEEDYGEFREKTWDTPGKQNIEELQEIIKELKQEK
jgi:hypothetical protein